MKGREVRGIENSGYAVPHIKGRGIWVSAVLHIFRLLPKSQLLFTTFKIGKE
jgi:hypothetical protein